MMSTPPATSQNTRLPRPLLITFFSEPNCKGEVLKVDSSHSQKRCSGCLDLCDKTFSSSGMSLLPNPSVSIRIEGDGFIEGYSRCIGEYSYDDPGYRGGLSEGDGCVNLKGLDIAHFAVLPRLDPVPVASDSSLVKTSRKKFRIVFSAESSQYLAWQARVNYHAFKKTQDERIAGFTRLLTSREPDDLISEIPTFQAYRHPFSRSYGPLNKPDVIAKWFESALRPSEDIIVVIDPDNWLLKDLSPIVNQVAKGAPVAQAAWFFNSPNLPLIWQVVCEQNCEFEPQGAAVPVFIHKDDLEQIAPLWRYYTMKVIREKEENPKAMNRFSNDQMVGWSVEMIGYVFAAAHLGIKHRIEPYLQMRDVDSRGTPELQRQIPMIHMGRAWFPESYEPGRVWKHTEGALLARSMRLGYQVWCKCNYTAWDIIPWPLPAGIDFVSEATLKLLHEAKTEYPEFPTSKHRSSVSAEFHKTTD